MADAGKGEEGEEAGRLQQHHHQEQEQQSRRENEERGGGDLKSTLADEGVHGSSLAVQNASEDEQYESESDDSAVLGRRRGEGSDDEEGTEKEQVRDSDSVILYSDNEDHIGASPEEEDDEGRADLTWRRRKGGEIGVDGEGGMELEEDVSGELVEGEGKAEEEGNEVSPVIAREGEGEDGETVEGRGLGEAGEAEEGAGGDQEEKKAAEPFVVPTSGAFYMHDDRFNESGGSRPRGGRGGRKLWESRNDKPWVHDLFEELNLREDEGTPRRGSDDHRGGRRGGRMHYGEERENLSLWDAAFTKPGSRGRGGSGMRGRGRMRAFRDDENEPLPSNEDNTNGEGISAQPPPLPGTGEYLASNAGRGHGRSYLRVAVAQKGQSPQLDNRTYAADSAGRSSSDAGRGVGRGRQAHGGRMNTSRGGGRGSYVGSGEVGRGYQGGARGIRRGRAGMFVGGDTGRGPPEHVGEGSIDSGKAENSVNSERGSSNLSGVEAGAPVPAVGLVSQRETEKASSGTAVRNISTVGGREAANQKQNGPGQVSGGIQQPTVAQTTGRQTQVATGSGAAGSQQPLREGPGGSSVAPGGSWNAAGSGILYGPSGGGGSTYGVAGANTFMYGSSGMRVNAPDFSPQGNAVALQYGGQGGAMGVPGVDLGMATYANPGAPQYAYTGPEVTWVPVIAPGGAPAYGSPYMSMEAPPSTVYYASPSQQPPFGPSSGDSTGKTRGGLWKPPPMQEIGGDQYGQRQSKPRRYSEMNFCQ